MPCNADVWLFLKSGVQRYEVLLDTVTVPSSQSFRLGAATPLSKILSQSSTVFSFAPSSVASIRGLKLTTWLSKSASRASASATSQSTTLSSRKPGTWAHVPFSYNKKPNSSLHLLLFLPLLAKKVPPLQYGTQKTNHC